MFIHKKASIDWERVIMRKNMAVAIAAGLVLAFGMVGNASADGYEYYVPKPEPKKHVYEHHEYEQTAVRTEYVHVEESNELNGKLSFSGWSGGVGNSGGASGGGGGGGGGFAILGGGSGFGFGGAGAFAGAAAFARASASGSFSGGGGGGHGGGGHGGGGGGHGGRGH
jgi:hypothetical protein